MSRILVTGATGNVGSRIVRLLATGGHPVRALTRKGESSRFAPGVELATGDYEDKESLRAALKGVSRVYLLAAGLQLEQHEANLIEAAKAARVERVVKHSVAGAQYKAANIPRWHRAGEERLEASGLPFVFLRPASFASNALGWAATIKAQDTVYGALGEASLPVIDPEDIAEAAVTVLSSPGHAGKAYELSGPESLTTAEQVSILAALLGRRLKYVNVPDSAAREAMVSQGMVPPLADAMVDLVQTLRSLGHLAPSQDVKQLLGREPRSFRQWAANNVGVFS